MIKIKEKIRISFYWLKLCKQLFSENLKIRLIISIFQYIMDYGCSVLAYFESIIYIYKNY
jgi:hypothetical protein